MGAGLAHLIAPTRVTDFQSEYWERRPLVNVRGDSRYYRDLFSLEAAEEVISTSHAHSLDVHVVKDGRESPIGSLVPPGQEYLYVERVYDCYRHGSTIVLQMLQQRWRPLLQYCAQLSAECSLGFQVNAYLTPRGAQGLGAHYDTHDVFVAQIEGSKRWRLFDSPMPLPLPSQPYRRNEQADRAPLEEFDLHAGDLLYLPRGVVHEAIATEERSLHLTIGVHHLTWADVLRTAVEDVLEKNAEFRKTLPLGFGTSGIDEGLERHFRELVGTLVTDLPYARAVENAHMIAQLAVPPLLSGHLRDLDGEAGVTLETGILRRQGVQSQVYTRDGEVCLRFHGKEISFPDYVEEDIRFLAGAEGDLTAKSLPGRLDETGRMLLLRRLLREGFLTLSRARR